MLSSVGMVGAGVFSGTDGWFAITPPCLPVWATYAGTKDLAIPGENGGKRTDIENKHEDDNGH